MKPQAVREAHVSFAERVSALLAVDDLALDRPSPAQRSLELTSDGRVVVHLKRAWRDGTTAAVFEPLDLLSRLVALIPWPRMAKSAEELFGEVAVA